MASTTQETINSGRERQEGLRLVSSSRRRWRWISAGVLLVSLGAGTGVWASLQGEERVPIVAAARDLPAGHVLSDSDLRVVQVAGADALDLIDSRAEDVVGQRVAFPVREGTPLTRSAVGEKAKYPQEGEAIVAAAVAPGVLPASAVEGSPVAVIITDTSSEATSAARDAAEPSDEPSMPVQGRVVAARVHSIQDMEDATGSAVVVELVVEAADAEAVARATGAEAIRLAVTAEPEEA